ncbi:unnamed protein product, partial [Polarella glacialis]
MNNNKQEITICPVRPLGSSESKALGASSLIQRRGTEGAEGSFMCTAAWGVAVRQGDLIQVLEQHNSGWTYAKILSLADNSTAGWVPSYIVQQAPYSPCKPPG